MFLSVQVGLRVMWSALCGVYALVLWPRRSVQHLSVRDQCCLNEPSQWCRISRGVQLAPVWCEGRQDAGFKDQMSADTALTQYPGTTNVVKSHQVACLARCYEKSQLPRQLRWWEIPALWSGSDHRTVTKLIPSLSPQVQRLSWTFLLLLFVTITLKMLKYYMIKYLKW